MKHSLCVHMVYSHVDPIKGTLYHWACVQFIFIWWVRRLYSFHRLRSSRSAFIVIHDDTEILTYFVFCSCEYTRSLTTSKHFRSYLFLIYFSASNFIVQFLVYILSLTQSQSNILSWVSTNVYVVFTVSYLSIMFHCFRVYISFGMFVCGWLLWLVGMCACGCECL